MIEYTVVVSPRARSIRIKVLADGSVVVVKPRFGFFLKSVDAFVAENEAWIVRMQKQVTVCHGGLTRGPGEILVFGQTYNRVLSAVGRVGVTIVGDELRIHAVSDSEASVARALQTFFKTTAEKYIVPRTHQLGEKMGISFRAITLRQQKTRWGSCSSAGNLNFNWQLVHCPPAVIDYVIIHELSHRRQMNHGAKFWALVQQYDPEYQKHRGWLKRQGMDLE